MVSNGEDVNFTHALWTAGIAEDFYLNVYDINDLVKTSLIC